MLQVVYRRVEKVQYDLFQWRQRSLRGVPEWSQESLGFRSPRSKSSKPSEEPKVNTLVRTRTLFDTLCEIFTFYTVRDSNISIFLRLCLFKLSTQALLHISTCSIPSSHHTSTPLSLSKPLRLYHPSTPFCACTNTKPSHPLPSLNSSL